MPDALAEAIIYEQSNMEEVRSGFDQFLTDIREFVRPATSDFYGQGVVPNPQTNVRCYDSTAMWAAEQLASGYAGFLTPSNDRWADIVLEGDEIPDRDGQMWLDAVSDVIFREYGNPYTRFTASMQEDYLDLAAFGTSHLLQEYNVRKQRLQFRAYATADCWVRESADGQIDVHHRITNMTTRQLYQEFDHNVLNGIEQVFKDKANNVRRWDVMHVVRPNSDELRAEHNISLPFISLYVLRQTKDTLKASGYNFYPYTTGREKVVAGQVYGQSNAFTNLPAIKMLNSMMRTVIKAANKAIDPPTMAPSDGFMVPLSADAGALWWYDAAMMTPDAVKQFPMQGRFDISDTLIADVRNQITRGFHVDWLIRDKKNERQTATEILDDRDEMLRQLSPTLGRLETDKAANIVRTSYRLLNRHGRLPPAPTSVRRKRLDVRFQSPAARAQFGARGADVQRYINDITPMLNIWPSMVDNMDPDAISRYIARVRNLPGSVILDEEAVAVKREADAREQQANQMLEGAPQLAGALKDVAQAESIANAQT
jgi:hypothetical protein